MRYALLLMLSFFLLPVPPLLAEESEEAEEEEPQMQEPTVEVDSLGVRVQPQLEFIIPFGVISQQAEIPIGGSVISTKADFDLASSAVAGEVGLSRRRGRWEPGVSAYQRSDAEGFAQPRITGGEILLAPDDLYLERKRGIVGSLNWYIREDLLGLGTIEFNERIETRLSEPEPGEEIRSSSFEAIPSVAMEFRSLRIETPRESPDIKGRYLRFTLSNRFVNGLMQPAALSGQIATLITHQPGSFLRLEHHLSGASPLFIWERDLVQSRSYGGFDTLRGYGNGEISESRALLSRNTISWRPVPREGVRFDSPVVDNGEETVKVRLHNLKALLAVDALLAQEAPELDSPVRSYLSFGPGAAVTVSAGDSIHFDLRSYVAVPWDEWDDPVFYLQGSIFSVTVD
ncbi:MAG: hypothetical protein ACOC28_03735 [Alkalispirochaetaceae bacterium]